MTAGALAAAGKTTRIAVGRWGARRAVEAADNVVIRAAVPEAPARRAAPAFSRAAGRVVVLAFVARLADRRRGMRGHRHVACGRGCATRRERARATLGRVFCRYLERG